MFRVLYKNKEKDYIKDFIDVEQALMFAEKKYRAGLPYIKVTGEFDNTIVEYEN